MLTEIVTPEQYRIYLKEVENLIELDPKEGTSAATRLKEVATLVEQYEKERFHLRKPSENELFVFRLEQSGDMDELKRLALIGKRFDRLECRQDDDCDHCYIEQLLKEIEEIDNELGINQT